LYYPDYQEQLTTTVEADRQAAGKKPLKLPDTDDSGPSSKKIKVSRTDSDCGFMVCDEKPKGFFYLE